MAFSKLSVVSKKGHRPESLDGLVRPFALATFLSEHGNSNLEQMTGLLSLT